MFETTIGPVKEAGATVYLRPETAQGIFLDFKTVAAVRAQEAAVRHRPGRQVVPQRDHAGQLHLPHARVRADGDGVLRPARRGAAVARALAARSAWTGTCASASAPTSSAAPARRRRARHYSSATSDVEYLLPHRLVRARGHRQPRRLRPHPARPALRREARVLRHGVRRALRPARDRAGGRASGAPCWPCCATPTTRRRSAASSAPCCKLHPRLAPIKVAVLPLVRKDGQPELAHEVFELAARPDAAPSTTRAARSASATAARTRSARRSA